MVFLEIFLIGFDSGIRHLAAPNTVFDSASFGKLTVVEVGCSISKGLGIWDELFPLACA
jgi:uncharacterized membrane protein